MVVGHISLSSHFQLDWAGKESLPACGLEKRSEAVDSLLIQARYRQGGADVDLVPRLSGLCSWF